VDEPGVSSPMLNSLEMIIKFSNDIVKEKYIEVPARMTWMDGLQGGSSDDPKELSKYGLKILFVMMCSPRATDIKLKILDDFLNGPKFSLENVAPMGIQELISSSPLVCRTKMLCIYNKHFKKSNMDHGVAIFLMIIKF